ncbi:MAG: hypothetical protein U0802_23795 [Candidatus Binatia bacterium]
MLVLSLERREGDPRCSRRRGGCAPWRPMPSVYADAFAITDPFHRRAVCDRLARLTLMLFDGVFVASQIEPDATDLRRAFETIAIAVKATGEQLMAQTARETSTDGMKGERR